MTNTITYAVGDVHGMLTKLESLLEKIKVDYEENYSDRLAEIVFLGDYVDRGPDSRGVLSLIMSEPLQEFNFHHVALKGNHEDLMISANEHGSSVNDVMNWKYNGGTTTISSYPRDEDGTHIIDIEHIEFIKGLPLFYRNGDFVFVHAGLVPGQRPEDTWDHDLMWIRGGFLRYKGEHEDGVRVVHGHTPTQNKMPEFLDNRIGIDTMAFADDCPLTAVVIDHTLPKDQDPKIIQS